jgi:hypothetical protein
MRFALALALLAACGKSDPSPPPTVARSLDAAPPDAIPAALREEAARLAEQKLGPVPGAPPHGSIEDLTGGGTDLDEQVEAAEMQAQAEYMAGMLSADEATVGVGEMGSRRPGTDLGAQLADAHDAGTPTPFTIELHFADPADPGTAALTKIESAYRPGLRRCLRAAKFTGGPELALTIAPTGNVTSARVSHGDAIADCVEGQARNWRFATTERETQLILQLRVPEVP